MTKKPRITQSVRLCVLKRDREQCVYCGARANTFRPGGMPIRRMHVDHLVPYSRGGSCDDWNLACTCDRCNLYKGDRTPEEAGLELDFLQPGLAYECGMIFYVRTEGDPE